MRRVLHLGPCLGLLPDEPADAMGYPLPPHHVLQSKPPKPSAHLHTLQRVPNVSPAASNALNTVNLFPVATASSCSHCVILRLTGLVRRKPLYKR